MENTHPNNYYFVYFIVELTCSCGSMVSGQRPALVTKMPFSVEMASRGSPCEFHVRTVNESAIIDIKLDNTRRNHFPFKNLIEKYIL